MADVLDQLSSLLLDVFGQKERAVVSEAPGAGPEAEREGARKVLGMSGAFAPEKHGAIGSVMSRGNDQTGYGGHGDAVIVDNQGTEEIQQEISESLALAKSKRIRPVSARGRFRMGKWFWLEGHSDQTVGAVMGPFSLFDGTLTAPGAGNSVQTIPVSLPTTAVSPVIMLDRYPGMLYVSLFIRSFAFVPLGATGTGLSECWFTDITGATAGLGIYNVASQANDYESINTQLSGPLTDPGNAQLGTIFVNNLSIGGTPTNVRWQITIGFMAFVPDPFFNEQVILPPMPAEIIEGLQTMGAQGR